jgi:hypothetical protein
MKKYGAPQKRRNNRKIAKNNQVETQTTGKPENLSPEKMKSIWDNKEP